MKRHHLGPWAGLALAIVAALTGCSTSPQAARPESPVTVAPERPVAVAAVPPMPSLDRSVHINVVFLDDASADLPTGVKVRRNHWPAWEKRLPTFLARLRLAGDFQKAVGEKPDPSASVYGLEIAASLPPDTREELTASELGRIQAGTRRPSAVLALGSAAQGQLRLVFQDILNYPPAHAAKVIRVLGEICPAVSHARLAVNFGPFRPPPTIIFDPRPPEPASGTPEKVWGLLEDTYLLPHYVLHALALLNNKAGAARASFYAHSTPEPGVGLVKNVDVALILGHRGGLDRASSMFGAAYSPDGLRVITAKEYLKDPDILRNIQGKVLLEVETALPFTVRFNRRATDLYRVVERLGKDPNVNKVELNTIGNAGMMQAAWMSRFLAGKINRVNAWEPASNLGGLRGLVRGYPINLRDFSGAVRTLKNEFPNRISIYITQGPSNRSMVNLLKKEWDSIKILSTITTSHITIF